MTSEYTTKSDIALVRADLAAVHTELRAEVAVLRAETRAEFAAVRAEVQAASAALRADMKSLESRLLMKLGALIVVLIGVWPEVRSWLGG